MCAERVVSSVRRVEPEWLDELPAEDPRALRSRADLRRVNRLMGAVPIVARALDRCVTPSSARLVELGAGDGTLALRLSRRRGRRWPGASLMLLDLKPSVGAATLDRIRARNWNAEVVAADALEWLEDAAASGALEAREPQRAHTERPVVFANLFVHHFDGERLARLFAGVAGCAGAFVCCEPRRSTLALAGSRLLWLIAANDVTRHDAVVSVRAGFEGTELSDAWRRACAADADTWRLEERRAGAFSHLFVARRAA